MSLRDGRGRGDPRDAGCKTADDPAHREGLCRRLGGSEPDTASVGELSLARARRPPRWQRSLQC
jgi:hypothetical protein